MKESIKGPIIRALYALLPDKLVVSLFYRVRIGHKLNWKNPTTFTEKMNVAKFDKRYETFHPYCDKLKAKELATSILGEGHVIPTIYHTKKLALEDFGKFPESFVIKSNHNSQDIDFVWEKSKLTDKEKKRLCKKHNRNLKHNMAERTHELQYKLIDPEVMIEPIFGIEKGESLTDYKFYCFHGKPEFVLITIGRFQNNHREAFDRSGRPLGFTTAHNALISSGGGSSKTRFPRTGTNSGMRRRNWREGSTSCASTSIPSRGRSSSGSGRLRRMTDLLNLQSLASMSDMG